MRATDYKHIKCGKQLITVISGGHTEEIMTKEESDSYVDPRHGYCGNCSASLELDSDDVEKIN